MEWLSWLYAGMASIFVIPYMVIYSLITGDTHYLTIPEVTPAMEFFYHMYEVIMGWFL